MTWNIADPQGNEAYKIRWEIVQYTKGRGLDLGSGVAKTYQHWIGVDNCVDAQLFGAQIKPDVWVPTCEKLDVFASQSMDFVFSSHLLEHFDESKIPGVLTEWCRVVKPNGYLVLYVPDADEYPKVGQPGANPDHKVDITYDKIVEWMETVPRGWDLVDYQKRNQDKEYSHYAVFKVLS
ncbi:MAG TPA: class I SAM-dependent methyltransferase [Candidatus Acidoferrales bacterium]|nr:class I SAM-dependent methyltransferase [Candidatus Acidoferrales bacterium]